MSQDNYDGEWFSLLEASNPIYDDDELDALYANSNEAVSESVNLSSVKVGEVYHAGLPFFNFDDDVKYRWGVIIDLGHGDLRFLMCSSADDTKKSKQRARQIEYNYTIKNWKQFGFTKESFSCGSVFFPLTEIKFRKKMGEMSKTEYDQCMIGVRLFLREKFKTPWNFMNWMKNEVIKSTIGPNGNNNLNPIQTLKDIEKSKRANCVDIALAVYDICKRSQNTKRKCFGEIAWMKFLYKNGDSSFGHVFAFWKYYNNYYALRFVTELDNHPSGEIVSYFNAKPDEIVCNELEFFRPKVEKKVGEKTEPTYWIFDQNDIEEVETSILDKVLQYDLLKTINDSHEFIHLNNEGIVSTNNNFFFFHMVPKGTDISDGLLSPAAMSKLGMREELKKSLDKYRERMVKGWRIYPGKLPEELNETELIQGLEKFRGNGGSRTIYFFRYPPTKILGKNMSDILKEKDIYRINLNDPKLQDYIERIDWGYYGSHTDNKALTRDYYENISEKEYFSEYNDNPSDGSPLFASIPHIGIVFKDGICPKQFLSIVTKSSDVTIESFVSEILPGDTVPGYPTRIFVKDLGDGSYCFDDTQVGMRMRTLNDKENGFTTDNLEANFAAYQPVSIEVVNENVIKEAPLTEEGMVMLTESEQTTRRILLTSAGLESPLIRSLFVKHLGYPLKDAKVLFVTAAAIDKESRDMIPECRDDLINAGIDLRHIVEYNFETHKTIEELNRYQAIYFCGGDENHLMRTIIKRKMDQNLKAAVNNGLFYIGVSAGACIGSSYVKDGLRFIPHKVDVHYDPSESTKDGPLPSPDQQINLSNSQAVWIYGDDARIVGGITSMNEGAEFKPIQKGYNSSIGKYVGAGEDKYIGYFEADEKDCLKEAHQYIDKKLTYADVKKNMEFIYDDDGIANGVYLIDGQKYRVRVETIVKREVNGTSCVFFEKKKEISHYGSMYKLPGGSVEPDKSLAEQAECEVNEEILVKVKNVHYTGKYYIVKYDPKTIPEWHKRILWPIGLKYVGAITFVFTAEYDGPYKKKVAKVDQDSLAQKGDWYPVWEFEEIKADIHQGIALESFNMEVIEEASIYTQKYKDFDEFCEYIQTPEEVATWYSKNHVIWPPGETGSDHPFRWPNDIIKHKIGNCYDHALFMHYFCNRKGIPNKQVQRYTIYIKRNERTGEVYSNYCGHIITLFEKDGRWYEFDPQPHRQKSGNVIEGPFDSVDEYIEDITECMELWGRKVNIGYKTKCGTYVYTEEEQKVWDKFYNAPIKDRDEFNEKYLPKSEEAFNDYKNGKMKPIEQKQYFEHIRVCSAILRVIIRHGIKRVKNEVINFFNESADINSIVNKLESMEVVEESDNSLIGTKIIPVDLSKYNKPGTRVLCFNPHITKTMAKALGRTAKNAFKSTVFEKEKDRFMTNMAWDGFDLFMQYSKSIMAVDIVSVNEDQCLTTDLEGFPVIACESGKVVHAQDGVGEASIFNRLRDTVGPEGNTVIIAHDNKTVTLYAHLQNNSITVRKGDIVHKGQVIGKVGNTGDCTIPHLHFETSGTTWKDAGIGRQHVGFAPFMCTDIGIIDAFKKSTYDEAYKTPMEINDTGVFGTAFFLTNDSRYVKESVEVVTEGFFSKGKKNIIPLDLDSFQLPPGERVICMNTHIINITTMYSMYIKEQVKSFKSKYGNTFFGFVRSIPDFCKAVKFVAEDSLILRDQMDAVDFIGFKQLKTSETITSSLLGCPVVACNDGIIVAIVNKDGTYETLQGVFDMPNNFKENIIAFGNAVMIEHDNGNFYSMYGHLIDNSIKVKLGERVERGQYIAKLGNTGNSSGPHLHFELFYNTKLLGVLPKRRTNFEPYECTIIEPDGNPETLTKEFYEKMKLNESGVLHWCCFLTDPPPREVKEMLEVIEESSKKFKSSKVKNFDEFCKECKTPEDAMNWFIANKVVWNDKANNDYMRWPDTLIQERKGNCLDQSVMMHFFFKRKRIDHRMALFTIRLENGTTAGHIFPLFKRGKFIYAWLYIGPGHGVITGPYHSWYDAAGMVTEFYKVLLLSSPKKGFDAPISDDTEWSVQEYSETEHLDKYLNKKIVQKDYLYADGGDNLWSTHFFSHDFHFIRIPKITGVMYKLISWSKQYQTPKNKPVKEAFEIVQPTTQDIEDENIIKNTFSEEEKLWWNCGNNKENSDETNALVFRRIIYDGKTPCGFVHMTDSGKLGLAEGDLNISIAVHKQYRGQGLAVKLIKEAIRWFKNSEYTTISFIVRKGNTASYRLAEKCGFVFMQYWEKTQEYWFMITNPNRLKSIGESVNLANPVQEEYKLSVYTKQYKTMDEFCKQFKTFDDVVRWFQANHIKWPDYKENNEYGPLKWTGEIHWPEDLLRDKIGNCFDQALFVYYFCKKNKLTARMYRIAAFYDTKAKFESTLQCTSHFITTVECKSGIFIFSYQGIQNATMGPFTSYEKAVKHYEKYYWNMLQMVMYSNRSYYSILRIDPDKKKSRIEVKSGYFTEDDMKFFDMTYGDKRLTQNEYVKKSKGCVFPEDGKVVEHTLFSLFLNKLSTLIGVAGNKISDFISSKEATEEPIDVKNVVPMGICDYVLQYLGNAIDIQKFADIKSGRRFMYTYCTVMKKHIPLILLLAYCEGLTTVLRKAEVNFFFTDTRPRIKEYESVLKGVIPFADGYLVYDKFPLEVSLLMNGLALVDTKGFEYAEMDGKDVYVSLFDILFGTRMLANAFDNFYDWMIDPVTYTVLQDLNYPTDFVGLLLAGNKLLADNNYTDELDMRNYRVRSNEMAYAYAFKKISEAYGKFRMTSNNKNPDKISIPQGSVIKDIMQSQMVEDVSELSPIVEVEKAHTISDKGPSGRQ